MRKRKKLFITVSVIIIVGLMLPFLVVAKLYEDNFGGRFKTSNGNSYRVEMFEGLDIETYRFKSKQKINLQGYRYYREEVEAIKGVIVLAHGFGGGGQKSYMPEIAYLVENGYEVFAYDATGNDESDGENVRGLPQGIMDLESAVQYVRTMDRYVDSPVLLYGHSWGGYSVISYLAKDKGIEGAVSLAGFNGSTDMLLDHGERMYGKGVKLFKPYMTIYEAIKFGSVSKMTGVEGLRQTDAKVLMIQSEDDKMISFDNHFKYLQNEVGDRENITFLALNNRNHEPVRTEEAQQKTDEINKKYRTLIEEYGSRESTPKEKLDQLDVEFREAYRIIDEEIMAEIVAFYDEAVGTSK